MSNVEGAQKLAAKIKLLSWNGEHVTYWPLENLGRYVKDLRGLMRMMADAESRIVRPPSGLILPPGITPSEN